MALCFSHFYTQYPGVYVQQKEHLRQVIKLIYRRLTCDDQIFHYSFLFPTDVTLFFEVRCGPELHMLVICGVCVCVPKARDNNNNQRRNHG